VDAPQQRLRAAAAVCLTAVIVSSCAGHPSAASPPSAPTQAQSAGGALSGDTVEGADQQACVGVEAILAHITVDTAHWSPTFHPFDQDIAVRLASQSRELNSQAAGADLPVRRAVAATATAFGGVADAIMAKKRHRLQRAIDASRTAYSGLKVVCKIHN
jgi:hypothetical protein